MTISCEYINIRIMLTTLAVSFGINASRKTKEVSDHTSHTALICSVWLNASDCD